MAINKIIYGENVLLDLTSDTVTANHLERGYTAHAADGSLIVGTMIPYTDSGWIDFTPASGSVQVQCKKRKIGNVVFLTGAIRNATTEQSAYLTILNDIGDDYTPSVTQPMIPIGADNAGWLLYANSDGSIVIRNRTGAAKTNTYISISCCYAL